LSSSDRRRLSRLSDLPYRSTLPNPPNHHLDKEKTDLGLGQIRRDASVARCSETAVAFSLLSA